MQKLGLNELREKYLTFFEGKGHLRHASFPLVPQGDASLLLINSGMAPLKPYFSGEAIPPKNRMTTCQKCIRTPDIERVGKTSRHGTFFEMLGNFSFGDYFKREACNWAWEFITEDLKIPKDRLHVTVYLDDDEAWDIWENEVGVDPSHISRLGKADNFWEIGSGPCGPSSEIYFDRGEKYSCGSPDCKVGCDCDRYVEFWNLVFTQFNNDGAGNYTELEHKNIDTGMGLERLACIMQEVDSLFDVDTIMNITAHVSEITGAKYGETTEKDGSLRVITDHIRSTTMMICDGVLPSNEGRGYVLRRLLRRAARHGKLLGTTEPFLYKVCETVIAESCEAYPELLEKRGYIIKVIRNEEEKFMRTIDAGMHILEGILERMKSLGERILSGEESFRLNDTYGFPVDLTLEILEERGFKLDRDGYDVLMSAQRERARAATAALGDFGWAGLDLGLDRNVPTQFTGYVSFQDEAEILAIAMGEELCQAIGEGDEAAIVLDKTPFYAESGGQVADLGIISSDDFMFEVASVQKTKDDKYLHLGKMISGEASVGQTVTAAIDAERRRAIMRAHSSTHLLQKALRTVLGEHVEQAGSLVTPDTVRFDFTHFSAVTQEELDRVNEIVNNAVLEGLAVETTEMAMDKAREMGAMALFGEKYGDVVRVVKMGDFSTELCGGTHLDNTAKIGSFAINSEFSVASGVRRIEAVVGKNTLGKLKRSNYVLSRIVAALKTNQDEIEQRIGAFLQEARENRRLIEKLRSQSLAAQAEGYLSSAKDIGGVKVITANLETATVEELRTLGDLLKDKENSIAAVFAAISGEKIVFYAVCGQGVVAKGIKAGDIIKKVSAIAGGSGGGKPDSAMGGGKDIGKIGEALNYVGVYVDENKKGE